MNKNKNKIYKVVITSTDQDTGIEKVEDETCVRDVFLMGDNVKDGGTFTTLLMNTTIMELATKLGSGEQTSAAVRLAACMMDLKKNKASGFEDLLLNALMKE